MIPPEWVDELYEPLVAYYEDNPEVTVIVDRRKGPDRRRHAGSGPNQRLVRDRRRARAVGTFPPLGIDA